MHFPLADMFYLVGHLRLEPSWIQVNTIYLVFSPHAACCCISSLNHVTPDSLYSSPTPSPSLILLQLQNVVWLSVTKLFIAKCFSSWTWRVKKVWCPWILTYNKCQQIQHGSKVLNSIIITHFYFVIKMVCGLFYI